MGHIPKVVCLNGNGIGQYCDVVRIPRKGETAIPRNLRYVQDSGKGVNNAIVIGRLGGDVAYIGKVGKDDGGALNESWLLASGVNMEHFWQQEGISTSLGLILLAENGENMIINFDSPGSDITLEEAMPHLKACKGAEYFLTGFEIPVDVALTCAKEAHDLGMKVFLNPSPIEDAGDLPEIPYVDTMCVNEAETRILLETEAVTDWEEAAKMLCERYKVKNTIITLGGDGALAYGERGKGRVSGIPVKLVDESGAGDAFMAVVVQNLIWGKNIQEALDYANKYCAFLVQKSGTEGSISKYLWPEEMREVLEMYKEGGNNS